MAPLLEVRDLKVNLRLDKQREVTAVDGVSFSIERGQTLGVVGESGCGKTLTASAIMRLLPPYTGYVSGGEILFEGEDLTTKTPAQMREIRGQKIAMIFQDPVSSLNPVYRIGTQMREALQAHRKVTKKEAREISANMLRKVGLSLPETRLREYPHQLSGGQRQRVMIAMSLLSNPALLIADEPASSLDVTIRAQIMELIRTLQKDMGMAILIISHNMDVIVDTADNALVMYAGKVAEYGTAEAVFTSPLHPYTQKLIGSIPRADIDAEQLTAIDGIVPPLDRMPGGCRFQTRCPYRAPVCETQDPPPRGHDGHFAYCHFADAGHF
ncbi:MAG: ABC transporter ATP-binding protein [Oscillospiraceae bacterium]|nr:ABC transporter ATP-binding protein [Oscillospiraceae bacterium]